MEPKSTVSSVARFALPSLALVPLLVTITLAPRWKTPAGVPKVPVEPTVKVVVPRERFGPYITVKSPDRAFMLVDLPQRQAPKNALHDLESIRDQRLNKILDAGSPVTADDLESMDAKTVGLMLCPRKRAFSFPVDIYCRVLPGCRVDVVYRDKANVVQFLGLDVVVLTVELKVDGVWVTVSTTPEQAACITFACKRGELGLWLLPSDQPGSPQE
jgi:Flp pilus assembly protein CpaB